MSDTPTGNGDPAPIAAVGAYAPELRIDADAVAGAWGRSRATGIQERAVPDADEDALTMAYEAAVRALDASEIDSHSGDDGVVDHAPPTADVDLLAVATTTPPAEEEDLTGRLGAMLGVPDAAARRTYAGSTNAGMAALVAAAREIESGDSALVVASDCPRGHPDSGVDHAVGAGAAAFLLGPRGSADLAAVAEVGEPVPGTRFRRQGSDEVEQLGVTAYERAAFSRVLGSAREQLDAGGSGDGDTGEFGDDDGDTGGFDAAAVQAPDGGLPYRAAGALGVDRETIATCAVVGELGDLGAASAPVSLARALADGHDRVLAAGYGSGATATLAVVERTGGEDGGAIPARVALDGDTHLSYAEYLRRRGEITAGTPEGGGAYVSVPAWQRSVARRYRLDGGRCPECNALTLLTDGACQECHALVEYDPVRLSRRGTVEAVSVISQGGAPPEFADQQSRAGDYATGVVAFDGPAGDAASVPAMVTAENPETVSVGDRVEATVRRIYTQEGVTRYGIKVRPLE